MKFVMKTLLTILVCFACASAPAYDLPDFSGHHGHYRAVQSSTGDQVAPRAQEVLVSSPVIVAFSPNGDCTQVIVDAIRRARKQILVQAYSFTSKPILAALAQAHDRGIDVEVIVDRSGEGGGYSGATYMANHGVPVWVDNSVHIAHNKVMVFDSHAVLTGSFNFSAAAQKDNAENILLLEDVPQLATAYIQNWLWRQSLSPRYGQ